MVLKVGFKVDLSHPDQYEHLSSHLCPSGIWWFIPCRDKLLVTHRALKRLGGEQPSFCSHPISVILSFWGNRNHFASPLPSLIYPSDSFILTPLESSSLTVPASYKYSSVIFKGQLIILPSGQPYFMAGSGKKLCNPVLLSNFQRNIFIPFLPVPAVDEGPTFLLLSFHCIRCFSLGGSVTPMC